MGTKDTKIGNAGKGLLYITALIVCTVILIACSNNDVAFIYIPVSGLVKEILSMVGRNAYFMLGLYAFLCFVCPGWLLSQLIFKGDNEVWSFAVYTSAPIVIITIPLFIGYLSFNDAGTFLSGQDMFRELIELVILAEVPVIIVAFLTVLLLKMLSKKTVNIIMGGLFVLSYFFLAICYSAIE